MRRLLITYFLNLTIFFLLGCKNHAIEEKNDELAIRKGLPHFINKIQDGTSVNIVYFGGSITEEKGWRIQSTEWLRERYPEVIIKSVNSSIGGTNSEFGAYRFDRDVKPYNPDLLLVEFAVNDSDTDSAKVVECMEAIVRKAKNHSPQTDICFIYTVNAVKIDSVWPNNLFKTVQAMETVASHYGIPSINFGFEIATQIDRGKLLMSGKNPFIDSLPVFTKDDVHPWIETGHKIYTEVFKRAFTKLENYSANKKYKLPEPISKNGLEEATMIPIGKDNLLGHWEEITPENTEFHKWFGNKIPGTFMTKNPGDQLTFGFTGTTFGINDVIGPKSGYLLIEIDGMPYDTMNRFDPFCFFFRRNFFVIDNLADTHHTATITLLDTEIDKYAILNSKNKIDSNPDLFKGTEWYVTAIMLNKK